MAAPPPRTDPSPTQRARRQAPSGRRADPPPGPSPRPPGPPGRAPACPGCTPATGNSRPRGPSPTSGSARLGRLPRSRCMSPAAAGGKSPSRRCGPSGRDFHRIAPPPPPNDTAQQRRGPSELRTPRKPTCPRRLLQRLVRPALPPASELPRTPDPTRGPELPRLCRGHPISPARNSGGRACNNRITAALIRGDPTRWRWPVSRSTAAKRNDYRQASDPRARGTHSAGRTRSSTPTRTR